MVIMDLKNNHPTPLYHLIYIVLRDKILRGIYPKGSNIPSENELVKEYSVSRITARRSLENLSRDGLVSRHRGRGTIVTYDMPVTSAKSGGMEDLMENLLMIAQETKVKILDFSYIEADAELKSIFQLQEGDNHSLQKTVRVRYQNKAPFSYVVAHVPEEIGRCYKKKDLSHKPLLALIEQAEIKISHASQTITAVAADNKLSDLLQIKIGSPALEVTRIVYDTDEAPVQYIKIFYRPDKYQLQMRLSRVSGKKSNFWQSDS